MVEIFSRQQLANVQNTATRMADIFSQVEKNVALFSQFLILSLKYLPKKLTVITKCCLPAGKALLMQLSFLMPKENIKSIYPEEYLAGNKFV